jgi:hypothetical protein
LLLERLPFGPGDATAGSETELMAAVIGDRCDVDLPVTIEASPYYRNLQKRAAAQDSPRHRLRGLTRFLADNPDRVWEHSWVRFPLACLHDTAQQILAEDLRADKNSPDEGFRSDVDRFLARSDTGESLVRLPLSYLLKLALSDALGRSDAPLPPAVRRTGRRLLKCFLNDNVSPETLSLHLVRDGRPGGIGAALAAETSQRFMLTQVLAHYANEQFDLRRRGQQATVYFTPHPPMRLKGLSNCVSDSFYREQFTSPCLSGWDEGEAKQEYMRLCHQALSRSQWHAVAKLWDSGLISSNLVVLPSVSNISLANNGTHVSLGSRRLGELLTDPQSGFDTTHEKWTGDLAVKIFEHFLPLFVGTYSAAPYRFDFTEFHAENVLGFLPHQLDYTQLRMLWRTWRKKAGISLFGHPISPSGYTWVDRWLSKAFRLKGDVVDDVRLIDYLVAPMSTDESPALDGRLENTERLKRDLTAEGIFDARMSFYALYRQRMQATMGFAGFEARYFSLSPSLSGDLAHAVNLQRLLTALAFHLVARGDIDHSHIPDDPTTESERRQMFFAAAIGVPHFYVRADSPNAFLQRLLRFTRSTRPSRGHEGYLKVDLHDYRLAALQLLRTDGASLVESLGLHETLDDLEVRLRNPAATAAERIKRGILERLGARNPLSVPAADFNREAERWYRENLRSAQIAEAVDQQIDDWSRSPDDVAGLGRELGMLGLGLRGPVGYLRSIRSAAISDSLAPDEARRLVMLILLNVARHEQHYRDAERTTELRIAPELGSGEIEGMTPAIQVRPIPSPRETRHEDLGASSIHRPRHGGSP